MSLLIAAMENNPYPPTLNKNEPFLWYLSCLAAHAPEFPKSLKRMVAWSDKWEALAKKIDETDDRVVHSFIRTTSAVDIISGGIKVNALPEVMNASINQRTAFSSTTNATLQHYIDVVVPAAQALGLNVNAFGVDYVVGNKTAKVNPLGVYSDMSLAGGSRRGTPSPVGNLTIAVRAGAAGSAPITPVDATFDLMGGTIKAVWGNDTIVAPSRMYAATDTTSVYMTNLTENIFRFTPALLTESLNQHTVNERISPNAHLSTTQFYYKLIRNTEGWEFN